MYLQLETILKQKISTIGFMLMLGNNFSNAAYSVATVFLDNGTRNWTVVGGHLGQDVMNLGENNLVSGMNVNTSDVPLGQTISDNLRTSHRLLHDLKGK